jgi:hypothetical protein
MEPAACVLPDESLRIDTRLIQNGVAMTTALPASLQILARSFFLQALVATATIAIVFASSPVATADPASVSPSPTTLAAR